MIWWLWTAFDPPEIHVFDVDEAWRWGSPEPDVAWLGEGGWVFRIDNMGIGLRAA